MIQFIIVMYIWSDGDEGMNKTCTNRAESSAMDTKSKALVLMNYFPNDPRINVSCANNSAPLITMMNTCHNASGNRWPNFIAVDFYQVCKFTIIIVCKFIIYIDDWWLIHCCAYNWRGVTGEESQKLWTKQMVMPLAAVTTLPIAGFCFYTPYLPLQIEQIKHYN